ncbi:hypothetical protein DFH27DRAFT_264938 [Peziza echinospora]|nr:hypothetical protein DFH27DRAFT_264938 [Peziza echinospora]
MLLFVQKTSLCSIFASYRKLSDAFPTLYCFIPLGAIGDSSSALSVTEPALLQLGWCGGRMPCVGPGEGVLEMSIAHGVVKCLRQRSPTGWRQAGLSPCPQRFSTSRASPCNGYCRQAVRVETRSRRHRDRRAATGRGHGIGSSRLCSCPSQRSLLARGNVAIAATPAWVWQPAPAGVCHAANRSPAITNSLCDAGPGLKSLNIAHPLHAERIRACFAIQTKEKKKYCRGAHREGYVILQYIFCPLCTRYVVVLRPGLEAGDVTCVRLRWL